MYIKTEEDLDFLLKTQKNIFFHNSVEYHQGYKYLSVSHERIIKMTVRILKIKCWCCEIKRDIYSFNKQKWIRNYGYNINGEMVGFSSQRSDITSIANGDTICNICFHNLTLIKSPLSMDEKIGCLKLKNEIRNDFKNMIQIHELIKHKKI